MPAVEPGAYSPDEFRADVKQLEEWGNISRRLEPRRIETLADRGLPALIQEASNARARAFEAISSSDGVRNERLWQKYAFRLDEEARAVRDQAGRPVEQVFEEREGEVRALEEALDERTRDLLERVVMAGLVRRLQAQVRELRETIQGINGLAEDLRFGESRFQFSLRQRPQFQRLLELLREQSVLQPALREELRRGGAGLEGASPSIPVRAEPLQPARRNAMTQKRRTGGGRGEGRAGAARASEARIDELIAEATIDCYDESEQVMGFHSMLEEHLKVPFTTQVLGVDVVVEGIELTDFSEIVANCKRGRLQQAISVLNLPLPAPPPRGAEWIEAYRRWARCR